MEVFAIGLLGLAGKYISDRFVNNTDDNYIEDNTENDETIENNKEYFNIDVSILCINTGL